MLLEEPEAGEEVGDGLVAMTLRPFQIVTLRLRRAPHADGHGDSDRVAYTYTLS